MGSLNIKQVKDSKGRVLGHMVSIIEYKPEHNDSCCRCGMDKKLAKREKTRCRSWGQVYKRHIRFY